MGERTWTTWPHVGHAFLRLPAMVAAQLSADRAFVSTRHYHRTVHHLQNALCTWPYELRRVTFRRPNRAIIGSRINLVFNGIHTQARGTLWALERAREAAIDGFVMAKVEGAVFDHLARSDR